MISRRQVLVAGAAGGATVLLAPRGAGAVPIRRAQPLLDPATIPKYVTDLVVPPVMPPVREHDNHKTDEYRIGVRQFQQQILPPGLPTTVVWGYGSVEDSETFSYPAYTIEARLDRPVRVTWINQLVDRRSEFLPPLLPVDPTLHWANPPGGIAGRDSMPTFTRTPGPYAGPVPMVTHLHGGHSRQESDGYPEAWYLPVAKNIPAGFARVGTYYDEFRAEFERKYGIKWRPGTATFQYGNDQRASTLWFHDHALGITRSNVYAGLAGFYLLRGGPSDLPPGVLPGPHPSLGDRPGTRYHEIPIVIQDRSFNPDGSLFYPDSRAFAQDCTNPADYIPNGDVPPIWVPEFFADTIVSNGRTWPRLDVEQRRYRLRLLNGCNARTLFLKIAANPTAPRPVTPALPMWLIGTDGGFLPEPVRLDQILLANANRADVIVDFTDVPQGTELYLINEGPDGPFQGGTPGTDFPPADVNTTGQVMKFVVGPRIGADKSVPPDQLRLPPFTPLGPATNARRLLLDEQVSTTGCGPVATLLGTVAPDGRATPLRWSDPVTENPALNSTEIWEFDNRTMDAHPMHIHQVQFQVVGRGPDGNQPPAPQESGFLDTVVALPPGPGQTREITRIRALFDLPGRYVWHCHIVEHEDNEMMRPYIVGPMGGAEHP
ncbi:multicopper oxidase domain-containing protein [Streptomyces malaysiensis]|uniref:multicopper oxidase domain-containing protein n=1 Tax=Streptomyces malaysiensis TaxID=92644 RepID=UPI0011CDBB3E|nr:multicopper oxidase domain-containing protein [Streptomyces malaysiensis]